MLLNFKAFNLKGRLLPLQNSQLQVKAGAVLRKCLSSPQISTYQ